MLYGEVTDFLEFYHGEWRFAAFNVADSAICVGAGLLILDMWLHGTRECIPSSLISETGSFPLTACWSRSHFWLLSGLPRGLQRAGLNPEKVTNLAVYCAIAGMLGAKLFMFLFDWRTYLLHPAEIFTRETLQAAGVFQGGLILAVLTAFLYMRQTDCRV